MASHQPLEMDSGTADSVTSTPRSQQTPRLHDDLQPRVRFMCSFGGQILPRPHDNQLRYVGGDTRIVAVHRGTTFSGLLTKLSKLSGNTDITIKYQLPNEDLDALISVSTDEDVENMMDEYDRLIQGSNPKLARLRLFLFPVGNSRSSSIGSLFDGSTKRENWFFDALNGGVGSASLERGRSEASSIVSEVPDYLFGLDNSDDPKPKNRQVLADNISVSDPGSPAPATSSPYCSTSSIPNLPPVKTKPRNQISALDSKENQMESFVETVEPVMQQQTGQPGNPVWHYMPESHFPGPSVQQMPVYYVPGPVQQVQQVHMQNPYVTRIQAPFGQIPVYRHQVPGMGQVYGGGGMRPVTPVEAYEFPAGMVSDGQQMYYGARNAPVLSTYAATMVPAGGEMQGSGTETKPDGR
ncbi:Phox/Bem1p [Macleaya cordata]|uniref:Phox/Bem1p n=1 Tax=Macleaya cordata TaxID=56857 RepID=A0A200Q8I8_MACCD|nr:Phox/Bem1p [Macleaya cordata]